MPISSQVLNPVPEKPDRILDQEKEKPDLETPHPPGENAEPQA
jgi:hypothetical protein